MAGVLVETKAGLGSEWAAVAGIGVNVNQAAEEFPEELQGARDFPGHGAGRPIDRSSFAVALLRELERTREFIPPQNAPQTLSS